MDGRLRPDVELLHRLTRRQLDALRAVEGEETEGRGAPLYRIAHRLGVSAPAALEHLGPLEALGLIERRRGKSRLTLRGRSCLVEYGRHHRVAERLFGRLGFSPEAACGAAREVDLALSHRTVERLCAAEGHPSVCPHGEAIPPCGSRRGGA